MKRFNIACWVLSLIFMVSGIACLKQGLTGISLVLLFITVINMVLGLLTVEYLINSDKDEQETTDYDKAVKIQVNRRNFKILRGENHENLRKRNR